MQQAEGGVYRIIHNDENEIEAIYFQDHKMKADFDKWPDLMLFDATYKLNDRRMPLAIMMIIDNNGESQIVGLFILKSENAQNLIQLFEYFKAENPNHDKIEIIMSDKCQAMANAFGAAFPQANHHLCIFHVAQIFQREMTTRKRNVTAGQRDEILRYTKAMTYSNTEGEYMEQYNKLVALNCPGKFLFNFKCIL